MKLRNLIFALFLAIGAIGFVSCTGDDGDAGPAGPAGPAGEPGDPGDPGEASGTYGFLASWSDTGTVACGDDLLTGMGALPGGPDAASVRLSAALPALADANPITQACADNIFGEISVDDVNAIDDALNLADGAFTAAAVLVLIKTGKGATAPEVVQVPSTEFNPATQVTTNKTFVGGKIFAETNFTTAQPLERLDLFSQCGVGTSPPNVVGHWRSVKIASDVRAFMNGVATPADDATTADTDESIITTITTTKVCVRLDAHPGATKCFVHVSGDPVATNNGSRIALYDGAELTTVKAAPAGVNAAGTLFAATDIGDTAPAVPVKLCDLFSAADPQ